MVLTLIEKEPLADNIWAFRFKPSGPFTWTPGQYMRVELPHHNPDAEGTKRWFTVSSAPYDGIAQITTRVTDSTFKQALSKLEQWLASDTGFKVHYAAAIHSRVKKLPSWSQGSIILWFTCRAQSPWFRS